MRALTQKSSQGLNKLHKQGQDWHQSVKKKNLYKDEDMADVDVSLLDLPLCVQDMDPHSAAAASNKTLEMRCFCTVLHISYKDHGTNSEVWCRIQEAKKQKLSGTAICAGLPALPRLCTVTGGRRRGRQQKQWHNNVKEWAGRSFAGTQVVAKDRAEWQAVVKWALVLSLSSWWRDWWWWWLP